MKNKTTGVLLIISLVMIICIGAVSAADTNETLLDDVSDADVLEEVSDTNAETTSLALEQESNATSPKSESVNDVEEIDADNSQDENNKVGDASSASNDVLSALNEDLLTDSPNFYYDGTWYEDLDDAVDAACDNNGGIIYLTSRSGGWGSDSDDLEIRITDAVSITFQPYNSGDTVIFDGQDDHENWFFVINDKNAHITFNNITFRNGGAFQGGAIEVVHGSLSLNYCIFEDNKAYTNLAGGYGWGGAIFLDEDDASLIAKNCQFINNHAASGGGAVCTEDGATATFEDCYFKGNTQGDDNDENHVYDKDGGSSSYSNCSFEGSGSIDFEVDVLTKSVTITPDVSDDVNYAVLYKNGTYYDRTACNDGDTAIFSDLERGTYTIYMMKNWEKRYQYSGTSFNIIEPYFIVDDTYAFENLTDAVNNISTGGSGVITVTGGTYTASNDFNVEISNKIVTLKPKSSESVTFTSSSQSYLLYMSGSSQLIIEDIIITGTYSDSALKFNTNSECTISDCEFKNILNSQSEAGNPIYAQNSNLVLNDCSFESNGQILFESTAVSIEDCNFTSNSGTQGGAIYADSSSYLTVTGSEFNYNKATEGGSIYASNLEVNYTEFIGNSAQLGGAIYITSLTDTTTNITNCVFDSNSATNYKNIYSQSLTRNFNLKYNEYDVDIQLTANVSSYGQEYIIEGVFDWGSNLNNTYTFLTGFVDDENIFGDLLTVVDNNFQITIGVLSGGTHEFVMAGMYEQGDSNDHFYGNYYYTDLYNNEFYLDEAAYAKTVIEKANITLNLEVSSVLIPEVPVLNVYSNWNLNYTILIGNKYYQLQVVNGKASMNLTGLDLGNYTVVGMRDGDDNYNLAMNYTTFTISKTYSNFLVLSTNVEYDTLTDAVANCDDDDTIYIKKGTYNDTGITISDKTLNIIALDSVVFDADGGDANFITVSQNAEVYIYGITFRGLHNRNTNYGAIVNHGDLTVESCNFTDNKITKTSYSKNGGAAIFSDGSSLDIESCNFINNVAPLKVSTAAVTSMGYEDVSIVSSNFINNTARDGGALYYENISQYEASIISCEFEQNIAVKGSAIYAGNNSRYLTVTLSDFKNNDIKNNLGESEQLEGGVIYVNANTTDVTLDIYLCNFENNSNSDVDGGVICLDGNSRAVIESCIFTGNKGNTGSVILIKNPYNKKLTLMIDSSEFADNNATSGAIVTSSRVITFIDECVFANNTGENRHIYSNGFTVVHDSTFDVKNAALNTESVEYGETSLINGTADIGTNIYAAANLTVAGENITVEIKNNTFTYTTGILTHGKYYAVLNSIQDNNNNTYLMDSITKIFRVYNVTLNLTISVDNITYGETLTVTENLTQNITGTIYYQLNGDYYTKDEIESLKLDAGNYTLVAIYDNEDYSFTTSAVNFEVYKANPTISVDDVEIEYNDTIIVNIETNVPSIYIIEIEDYTVAVFVNGSRSVEIEKTLDPGNYTIRVTSQERVNYISNFTEAVLKVNKTGGLFTLSVSDEIAYPDDVLILVSVPDNAVGNTTYTITDSDNNTIYIITQSCSENLTLQGLDVGTYEINAVFEGDDFYNPVDDIQLTFTINKGDVELTLEYSNTTYGQNLVITPQFNNTNVEGKIRYVVGTIMKTLDANESCIISGLDAGNYIVAAFYMGSDNYNTCKYLGAVTIKAVESLSGTSTNLYGISLMNSKNLISNANNGNTITFTGTSSLADEYEGNGFIYQYDEDSDYEYYDTLAEAISQVELWGAGIITVRGGVYSGDDFCGIDLEGELELTIRAYEGEEVIFDCENETYFLYLTTETEEDEDDDGEMEEEESDGPTLTLENITVINGNNRNGGAIQMDAGTLTLTGCNFDNNYAVHGGAIYIGDALAIGGSDSDASVIALNTTFTNNYAENEGGAIYIEAGATSMQDVSASFFFCTFLNNYQGEDDEYTMNYFAGDAASDITSKYCIFNSAGEIYSVVIDKINQTVTINGTSPDVFDSVVLLYFDETPLYSIYNNGYRDFNITFEDVINGNYTVGTMNDHNYNTYIYNVTFEIKVPNFIISEDEVYETLTEAIDAVEEYGIIYANLNYYTEDNMEINITKSFTLKNFRNSTVVFDGNSEKWFFTVAEGCTVEIDNICFTDGAVKTSASIENYGNLILDNCTFESFETGAVIYNSGVLNILNSEFSLNIIDNSLVWNDGELVIDTVEFSNNIINKSSAVCNNGNAEIISSNFTSNYNSGNGGAVYNNNSLSIKNTFFNDNEAEDGGAVYSIGILEVFNSTFEDNSANGYGGSIFNGNESDIINSTFTGGYAEKDGGAVYNNYTMTVDNSTFIGNTAAGKGGAIYNNNSLEITRSVFGINFADEFANIYNAGDIQFTDNIFDFYDVILVIPDGEYGIATTITGTLNPEFNMDIEVTLPGFVNSEDATVTISDGVFEYVTDILAKGVYNVVLDETVYDSYGNIYYGQATSDKLIIYKANVYINLTVADVILPNAPVLNISASKNGTFHILFNNKFTIINITGTNTTITLDTVEEGTYSVLVVREGDENYKDAMNTTSFIVSEYEGNFIVNSTGSQFETLLEAINDSSDDDIIYVREGNYTGSDNIGLSISNKKLTIISLGDVIFYANSTDLNFLTVDENSDVTINDIVITGFNGENKNAVIYNQGNLTVESCTFINNTIDDGDCNAVIYNTGMLNIIESGFYDNTLSVNIILSECELNITDSGFKNNTFSSASIISIMNADSANLLSNVFTKNILSGDSVIYVVNSEDIVIDSVFYNNTQSGNIIYAVNNSNLLVNNSVFTDNTLDYIILSENNTVNIISECTFTDNSVKNTVLSSDKNLSVLESVFSSNTLSAYGALNIASEMNATISGCVFSDNTADNYRNIYSLSSDLNISDSVFDTVNVDFSVYDIDFEETETINGSIDIGTNFNFTVNLQINSDNYTLNVTDNNFTYTSGILNAGDYEVVLSGNDNNSNTFVFSKITRIFTVNRISPGLNVTIANINQGEKLKVNVTVNENITAHVVYELNGDLYNKNQLENLTLIHGNYLISAIYRGDKNFLSAEEIISVEVYKLTPNITVSDVEVNYTDTIKVNVTCDVCDYYTVFIGNESVSLYVNGSEVFTFSSEGLIPDSYEILVYIFESDNYAEAYANATLTVNKASGLFNLSNDTIDYGENATISVEVPVSAYGNITYNVYDENNELVYTITQTCLEEIVVPDLYAGEYSITGTFEGDSYYTTESAVTSGVIIVNPQNVDLNITADTITYGQAAVITVESNVDGEYLIYVNNKPYTVTVTSGIGNVSVSGLTVGVYTVNVTVTDGNYSGFNETEFEVTQKQISVSVSVEDIVYGENAVVVVYGEVNGKYSVKIYDQYYTVNVAGGKGSVQISGLYVADDISVYVTIANGNYTAYNTTKFSVTAKNIPVIISIGNITYGEDTVVIVSSSVDGDYTVNILDVNYTVSVSGSSGVIYIPDLNTGENIEAFVTIVNGNYTAYNTTVFNIYPEFIYTSVSVEDIVYGEDAFVIVASDVDGNYTVNIRDVNYTVSVTEGSGNISISNLTAGNQIPVILERYDNYAAYNETLFNITQKQTHVEVSIGNITLNEIAAANIIAEIDATYILSINDTQYSIEVVDGKATLEISGLSLGNYTAEITIADDNYTAFNSTTFEVSKIKTDIDIDIDNVTYGLVSLPLKLPENATGNVTVYINGTLYQVVDVVNGSAVIIISNLNIGDNNITVVYSGDDNYSSFNKSVIINRKATIIASDMVKGYNSGLDYTANLLDDNGLPLANTTVSIKVGTTIYSVKTDSNGVLKFNKKLAPGNYPVAIINPVNDEYKLTNLKIVKRITGNKNVNLYFGGKLNYRVRIIGDDGKYVGAGAVVKIRIAGKTYSVKTDKNGYARLKLSLKAKKYTITATYKGYTTKNKITVKSVVKPVRKIVTVKKTAKKLKIKVKLKGRKVLKNKRVYLKFKGKTYKAKTNKKGIATFKIPKKVIKKLKKGKKYRAVFTYKVKTMKNTARCYVKVK